MQGCGRVVPIVLCLLILAPMGRAHAQAVAFESTTGVRQIKACVLLPSPWEWNSNPYLFTGLQRSGYCPPQWEFVNPLAQTEVTQEIQLRWLNPAHSDLGAGPMYWANRGFVMGNELGRTMPRDWPQYWEVPTARASELSGMDLIYVSVPILADTDPAWSLGEAVLKAVEDGALLWIDQTTTADGLVGAVPGVRPESPPARPLPDLLLPPRTTIDPAASERPRPFAFEAVAAATGRAAADIIPLPTATVSSIDILRKPYRLETWDVATIGIQRAGAPAGDPALFQIVWPLMDTTGTYPHRTEVDFTPLIRLMDGNTVLGPSAMVAPYGSGAILVTAGNVGQDIEAWAIGGGRPNRFQTPDIRFAVNALTWALDRRQGGSSGGQRASDHVRSPLQVRWQYPNPGRVSPADGTTDVPLGPVMAPPLHFNGRLYALANRDSGGAARLVCLDPDPAQDLCGGVGATDQGPDGNGDDGIQDYSFGAEYDVIWEYELPAGMSPKTSSPVGAYLPTAASPAEATLPGIVFSAAPVDASSLADGQVLCVNALTGAVVWTRVIRPYSAFGSAGLGVNQSAVCDVSTPAVTDGWVYVVASEYADGLPGPLSERTYGRAWCFDLATGGAVLGDPTLGGALWVYPDCDLDRDGTVDAYPENQKWLPAFNDPGWVADVGVGASSGLQPNPGGPVECPTMRTAAPIISSAQRQPVVDAAGTGWRPGLCDALMLVGTPLSSNWTGTGIFTNPLVGGSELALAPTPSGGDGTGALGTPRQNASYYCVPLNASQAAFTAARVAGGGAAVLATPTDTAATTVAHFADVNGTASGVRQFLAAWDALARPEVDRVDLASGCDIELQYAAAGPYEVYRLPGPVAWRNYYPMGQIRLPSGALADSMLYASSVPPTTLDQPMSDSSVSGGAGVTGLITALDSVTGAIRWRLDPRAVAPNPPIAGDLGTECQSLMSRPATADDGTLVTTVSHWPVGGPDAGTGEPSRNAVMGFRAGADFEVHLGPTLADTVGVSRDVTAAPVVRLLETGAVVAPYAYEVDYERRILRFPARYAYDVPIVAPDPTAGPDSVAGKALLVTWDDTTGTTHDGTSGDGDLVVMSPGHNFAYVPGFVKLSRYPVPVDSVVVTVASGATGVTGGAVVSGVQPGEPTVSYDYGPGAEDVLANGWLDLRTAYVDRNGNGSDDTGSGVDLSVVGLDLQVTYTGYDRRAEGWTPIAALAAFDDVNGFVPIPNPALGLGAERTQVPVAFGPSLGGATVAGRTILVGTEGLDSNWTDTFQTPMGGVSASDTLLTMNWEPSESRLTGRLTQPAQDASGFVPAVSAPVSVSGDDAFVGVRTLSTPGVPTGEGYVSALGTERTLIAAGSRIVECIGAEPARTIEGYIDTDGNSRPFGQIAKAMRLAGGNILVVDSGLSVVVEVDGNGRQVWPVGGGANNERMLLNKPTDAWRYYTTSAAGLHLMHTVIADSGNFRIVEVVSWPTSLTDPTLSHSVYVVSPETIAGGRPGERVRIEYQKAQPILDPRTGALWGYLASAANWNTPLIVEPPRWDAAGNYWGPRANFSPGVPSDPAPIGARIGEVGLAAGLGANSSWMPWVPLTGQQFANIRQVEYVTYGGSGGDPSLTPFGAGSATYAWVVASSYAGMPGLPMGVYEFDVAGGGGLSYLFTRADFASGATVAEENRGPIGLPNGSWLQKPFFPVSAKRLRSGDYLVANYSGLAENLSQANVGAAAIGRGLGSEVFTVTRYGVAPASRIYQRDSIPDPRRTEWPEPLSLLSYAERN